MIEEIALPTETRPHMSEPTRDMRPFLSTARRRQSGSRGWTRRLSLFLGAALTAMGMGMAPAGAKAGGVDFGRDVLPILSENCFLCHGPDAASRKANLRLDLKGAAL